MNIGSKIKSIRTNHQMNQQQFADFFHVTRQTVSNWENNKNYPDLSTLIEMSRHFEIPLDDLLQEDIRYVQELDTAKSTASRRKRTVLLLTLVICILLATCVWGFVHSFDVTEDDARIQTTTDVKMWVCLPGETPSRALTKTFDAEIWSKMDKYKRHRLKESITGQIEGDIPAVFLQEMPVIRFVFQNSSYSDLQPENVSLLSIEAFDKSTEETMRIQNVEFSYTNNGLAFQLPLDLFPFDEYTDWYVCTLTVYYSIASEEYVSVTALSLFNERH